MNGTTGEATETGREGERGGQLWRHPDFLKLWAGQSISEVGSNMGALSMLAILTLHATPAQMGLLTAMGTAPVLVIGLLAGVWVDRLRRRPVMILTDLLRAALLLAVPLAYWAGALRIEHLYVVMALFGALTVLFDVAYPSYLPSLVEKEHLVEGNSKLGMSGSVAHMAGVSVGFSSAQWIGAPLTVLADAFTFLVSAVSLGLIRKPEPEPLPHHERQRIFTEIREGLAVIWQHPLVRPLTLVSMAGHFFGFFFATLYSLYAIRTLNIPPSLLGIVIAVGGFGSFFGAMLSERLARRYPVGRLMIGSMLFASVLELCVPLAFGPPLLAAALLMIPQFFGDTVMTVYGVTEISLRQKVVPEKYLGRVNAGIQVMTMSMGLLGALAAGYLGEAIGMRMTLLIAVIGQIIKTLWLVYSPLRDLRSIKHARTNESFLV